MILIRLLILTLVFFASQPAEASKQVVMGMTNVALSNSATRYIPPMCGGGTVDYCDMFATRADGEQLWAASGTFSNFCVELQSPPGAGKSYVFTFYVNGSSTSITVTLSDSETEKCDSSNTASVTAGQPVTIESVPSSTPTSDGVKYSYVFDGDTSGESVWGFARGTQTTNTTNPRRTPPAGSADFGTGDDRRFVASTNGTMKNLYCITEDDPDNGAGVDSYTLVLREDGAGSALACTISDGQTTCNDLVNTVDAVPGDTYGGIESQPSGSPTDTDIGCTWVFLADTAGEFIVPFSAVATSSTSTTWSSFFAGTDNSTESNRDAYNSFEFLTKNIYVKLNTATDADGSIAVTLREDLSTDTAQTCTVGNLSDNCNATQDATVSALSNYTMQFAPSGTPGVKNLWGGMTGFLSDAPPAGRTRRIL